MSGVRRRRAWITFSTTSMILRCWGGRGHTCLQSLLRVCESLGIPLAADKQDGPSPVITLLGIIIDTLKGELRLPQDKLERLVQATAEWAGRKKACLRSELDSLVGTLSYAAKVIPPGRPFLRRAIELLKVARRRHHHIRLSKEFRADMLWWKYFAAQWNGASLVVKEEGDQVLLTSDASGTWGCGTWQGSHWFQLQWDQHAKFNISETKFNISEMKFNISATKFNKSY